MSKELKNKKIIIITFFIIGVIIIYGLINWTGLLSQSHQHHNLTDDTESGRKIKYWTCAMHPHLRLDEPGLSPICGMELIPVYEDEENDDDAVGAIPVSLTLNKTAQKLASVETSKVEYKDVYKEIRLVGKVDYDESRISYISAWFSGRIDTLYADRTGVKVYEDNQLFNLYSPEVFSAQEEFLRALNHYNESLTGQNPTIQARAEINLKSAKEKLRLLGITEKQLEEIETKISPSHHITFYSPVSGTIIEKNAYEGKYVRTGERIYKIADLNNVWVILEAYETDIQWLREGQEVEFETKSFPGEIFTGKISFIEPFVNSKTRTVKIRIDVDNPEAKLKPDMFVRAKVKVGLDDFPLVIPATAPLITGRRAVVYVEKETSRETVNRYEGREVVLGPRVGNYYIVKSGLSGGEKVVTRGNFKIDSAMQIHARPSMMSPSGYYTETDNILTSAHREEIDNIYIIKTAIPYYIKTAKALADDNVHIAADYFEKFKTEIIAIIEKENLESVEKGIAVEIKLIESKIDSVSHNIDSIRKQFYEVSEVLRSIFSQYEYNEDLILYLAYCSMAFDDKGGYWFQDTKQISNPYYGSGMLRCGEIIEEYGRKILESAPAPAGHQH